MSEEEENLITSAATRLIKLGGLVGRVGVSMAGGAVSGIFKAIEDKEEFRLDKLTANAARVVETLGSLKGVPMKLGQMLSLHEGFLPPEVTAILSQLQQSAPAVPYEKILEQIKRELGANYELIESLDEAPYASASIGQVHRVKLKDGREAVLKVQYPGIDEVIQADMKNLKGLLKMIFSMFIKMDLDPVWEEMNERLLEELDYEREASNMRRMSELHKNNSELLIPEVIEELTTRHVLGMALLEGISMDQAQSGDFSQDLRNRWGKELFRLIIHGLLRDRFLHADPNLGNFAFREDGKVILYDFGCMKEVPEQLADGYARLLGAIVGERYDEIPVIMKGMGLHKSGGEPIPMSMIQDYVEALKEPFRDQPPYMFGEDNAIYDDVMRLGRKYWMESFDFVFPKDIVFIDRTFGGHFGNLSKLKATYRWRSVLEEFILA